MEYMLRVCDRDAHGRHLASFKICLQRGDGKHAFASLLSWYLGIKCDQVQLVCPSVDNSLVVVSPRHHMDGVVTSLSRDLEADDDDVLIASNRLVPGIALGSSIDLLFAIDRFCFFCACAGLRGLILGVVLMLILDVLLLSLALL